MDIQDLLIFSRVSALQNLSQVGTELGLTPGTISKRIQALEEALAVRLFERTTRSIRITDEGRLFLEHVERILEELDSARTSMATSAGKPVGKLRVSAPQVIGRRYMAPALGGFLDLYPDIEVQLDCTDRQVNLHEEGYDIAIRSGALSDSTLIAKRLSTDRTVIAGSPDYFAANTQPQRPDDLQRHQCLMLGDTLAWPFGIGGQESGVRLTGRFRSDSNDILRVAALAGHGLIRSTEMNLASELASGKLTTVLSQFIDNSSTGVYALYVSGRHTLPRHRVFLDYMAEYFRTQRKDAEDKILAPSLDPDEQEQSAGAMPAAKAHRA